MLLIVLVSLPTTPPTPEQYAPFLWRPSCLSTYSSGDAPLPWWRQLNFWFAAYALAWIYVYRRFW
jgi:hypothetical protein